MVLLQICVHAALHIRLYTCHHMAVLHSVLLGLNSDQQKFCGSSGGHVVFDSKITSWRILCITTLWSWLSMQQGRPIFKGCHSDSHFIWFRFMVDDSRKKYVHNLMTSRRWDMLIVGRFIVKKWRCVDRCWSWRAAWNPWSVLRWRLNHANATTLSCTENLTHTFHMLLHFAKLQRLESLQQFTLELGHSPRCYRCWCAEGCWDVEATQTHRGRS